MSPMHRLKAAIIVAVLLLADLFSSCSQPRSNGPETSGYAPPQAISGEKMTIAYLVRAEALEQRPEIDNSFTYLQKLLSGKGWNIEFRMEGASVDDNGNLMAVQAVGQAVTAGSAADGYATTAATARELLVAGLTADVSGVVQQAAPALYGKYKALFGEKAAGLPLTLRRYVKGYPAAFYLKSGAEPDKGAGIASAEDVLSLLEGREGAKICALDGIVQDCMSSILDAWAGQQGYYSLARYGMEGALYAAYGDPQCNPVPVEAIPGFDGLFNRILRLNSAHRIVGMEGWSESSFDDIIGYFGTLDDDENIYLMANAGVTGDDFTAYPLDGCGVPMLAQGEPWVGGMLAVPKSSRSSAQLALFVQWALLDQENYDLVRYGAADIDYRLAGSRLEYLNNGKAMTKGDWDPSSPAYYFHNYQMFVDDLLNRMTIFAPKNMEAALEACQPAYPPIWEVLELRVPEYHCEKLFMDITNTYSETLVARETLLAGNTLDGFAGNSVDCLAQLNAMAEKTHALAEAYNDRLAQIMKEQEVTK